MANKILNLALFAGLGYAGYNALSGSEKKAATKALGFNSVPQNEQDFVALIKSTIKSDKELQRLLTGTTGSIGPIGETGPPINMYGNTFYNGGLEIEKGNSNYSEIYLKGLTKKFRLININDKFSVVAMGNDGSSPLVVLELGNDGSVSKIGGGSFSALSDERLKENVAAFTSGLEKVLSIETKTFNYKKVKGTQTEFYPNFLIEKKQYGVIAQQLQKVCPEMVTVGEDGFMTVDLSNLSLLLVNAVKELNTKDIAQQKVIDSQKTEIANLKKSLISIEERLTKLEAPTA